MAKNNVQTSMSFLDDVIHGLSQEQKTIPSKYFYDKRGSKLFDNICEQPEYYPPLVERRMLAQLSREIANHTNRGRVLIEPGAGNAVKVRLLLNELRPAAFILMDISYDYLKSTTQHLAQDYPWLPVHASCVDFTNSLPLPAQTPEGPRLLFFPGSTLGNFRPSEAKKFLKMVRETVCDDGMLLIGVDTKKNEGLLNSAYNDAAGMTAEFNLNLVHRMRNELGVDCNPKDFKHHAFYNSEQGRVEMHLVSNCVQKIQVNGHSFILEAGESVHTENSYKYSPEELITIATSCGFMECCHWVDRDGLFAMYLFQARH